MSNIPRWERALEAYVLQILANYQIDKHGIASYSVTERLISICDALNPQEQDIFLMFAGVKFNDNHD